MSLTTLIVISVIVSIIVIAVVTVGFRYFSSLARREAEKREKFKG